MQDGIMRKKNIDTKSENRLIYVDICFRNEAFRRKQTKNKKYFQRKRVYLSIIVFSVRFILF